MKMFMRDTMELLRISRLRVTALSSATSVLALLPVAMFMLSDVRADDRSSSVSPGVDVTPVRSFAPTNRSLQRIAEPAPSRDSARLNEQGVKLLVTGKWNEGTARIREAVETDGSNCAALYNLAGLLLSEGKAKEAVRVMNRAIAINPDELSYLNRLAEAQIADMDVEAAIGTYRKIVERDPSYEESLLRLGTLLGLQRKHEEAEAVLRRALELQPADPKVLTGLGSILVAEEKYEEGVAILERSAKIEKSVETSTALGVASESVGKLDQALAYYDEAKQLGSADPTLDNHIAALKKRVTTEAAPSTGE